MTTATCMNCGRSFDPDDGHERAAGKCRRCTLGLEPQKKRPKARRAANKPVKKEAA
jgi:hypothetical protein